MTPDIIAETWLGALAWAAGSQKCPGITPALAPKPTRAAMKMAEAAAETGSRECGAGNPKEEVFLRSRANAMKSIIVPAWVAMR